MEKFSTWRDAGTGIQPFLTPVPPVEETPGFVKLYKPIGAIIGILRLLLLGVALIIYGLGELLSLPLSFIPPLRRSVSRIFTALSCRFALCILGLWWIPVEVVTRKRGRPGTPVEGWNTRSKDIIVSNWTSWIEILYIAFRWNPVFVLPVAATPVSQASASAQPTSPGAITPGRRTGTGSAAISSPSSTASKRAERSPIIGFKVTSLLRMLHHTGKGPLPVLHGDRVLSLEEIRAQADRPIMVFPECTSSNGRALLRSAGIFEPAMTLPIKKFNLFVMCVRYDPPTPTSPSLSHPVPYVGILPNPIPHAFTLVSAPTFSRTLTIKLLAPSDSPSSSTFMASDYLTGNSSTDLASEACASLIAFAGKLKRTSVQGWEEKMSFLEFYRSKK